MIGRRGVAVLDNEALGLGGLAFGEPVQAVNVQDAQVAVLGRTDQPAPLQFKEGAAEHINIDLQHLRNRATPHVVGDNLRVAALVAVVAGQKDQQCSCPLDYFSERSGTRKSTSRKNFGRV